MPTPAKGGLAVFHRVASIVLVTACAVAAAPPSLAADREAAPVAIVAVPKGAPVERLAAKEVRRYYYLRTSKLLPIVEDLKAAPKGGVILVTLGYSYRRELFGLAGHPDLDGMAAMPTVGDWYVLKTIEHDGRPLLLVTGGYPAGPLYAAYRLAEHWGVRFYMHGDVVPDERTELAMPKLDEMDKPLFDRRGIQPFHDFPEGPDWWNADDYKAILSQLPKLRMNFFGLHCYPEGGVGPEPLVWIGTAGDAADDGKVKFSYPARHFTTGNPTGAWGYRGMKTGDYTHGAGAMYDHDDYGADYMRGTHPWNQMPPEQCNALFDRMGVSLSDVFGFAKKLGIKTCIGTETPLTIPKAVRERLQAAGKDPADPKVVQEVYAGMFQRIKNTHPLDYYWFWTPEGWTWSGVKQEQIDATLADLKAAMAAAEEVKAPFTLATCGWVLGPQQDRALFDNFLPKKMPMSCINRQVGHAPVEPGFANVEGRPKWAIPWMEDDPALNSPQLWVGRMRKDAADARAYGCTGLMGIHWRTRELGPNVAALAHAAWDQSGWNPADGPGAVVEQPKPPMGPDGGQYARFPNNTIADTDEAPIYQSVRYNVDAYYIDVPNGTYKVTLKLCEPHYTEKGKRVFGCKVQGKQVFGRLDLFAKVGRNRAIDYPVDDVKVTDGRLVIDFIYQVEYPCIAGIVVEGPKTVKINCGGPAWRDYQADWPVSEGSGAGRFLACADFYADWARSQFGEKAADPVAELFTAIDGMLPRPSDWVNGPGGIKPDPRPWEQVQKDYAFVDKLAGLRPLVKGPGNLERFDYWLNQFRYMRANAHVNCTWHRYNQAMGKVKAENDREKQKQLARELAVPIRRELIALVGEVHRHLLATVSTPGTMGNVTNWQQHIFPMLLGQPGEELAKTLGEPLPEDCQPSKDYPGERRIFVPTVRTSLMKGEPLSVQLVTLGDSFNPTLHWRPLGGEKFATVAWKDLERGVYTFELPPDAAQDDLEYYIEAEYKILAPQADGTTAEGTGWLHFPPTAPDLNQTVVVVEGKG